MRIERAIKDYFSDKYNLEKLAVAVASMSSSDQMRFITFVMRQLGEKQRIQWAEKATEIAYNQQWKSIEKWMEGVFTKDITRSPKNVAASALHVFKISKKMIPFFTVTARKVKRRVMMRKRRNVKN